MYYLERTLAPPYLDDDPSRRWTTTRQKMLKIFSDQDYNTTVPCRKLVDVLTFLSFVEFRGQILDAGELQTLETIIEELPEGSVPETHRINIHRRIRAMSQHSLF